MTIVNKNWVWLMAGLAGFPLLTGCKKQAGGQLGMGGMPPMQVVAVEAKSQPVTESLSLVGSVAANEMVEIKSETDGMVQEVLFDEGQQMKKGQLLLRLDETKLTAALNEAESNFKLSRANYDRAQQLLKDKLISQSEYDQAAATFTLNEATVELRRRELKDARIYAPFNGTLGARHISPGQVITKDTILTALVDLDPVKVEINVPERYLQRLKIGQPLEFTVAAFPAEKFRGEVYFISPQLDESLRTVLVKARIPNPDHKLRAGMFASLDLTLQVRESAIVIPEPAIISNGDNFSVFVVDKENKAQIRPVQVGIRLAGKAEIVKGLSAGEMVIVEGVQKIGPGSPVKLSSPAAAAPYAQN